MLQKRRDVKRNGDRDTAQKGSIATDDKMKEASHQKRGQANRQGSIH